MSLVQGYSSDSDDGTPLPVKPDYEVKLTPDVVVGVNDLIPMKTKRTFTGGTVESQFYDDTSFHVQRELVRNNKRDLNDYRASKKRTKYLKTKRSKKGDAGDDDFKGPWANYEDSEDEAVQESETESSDGDIGPKLPNESESEAESESESDSEAELSSTTTKFFGSSQTDYLGRSYLHIPQDLDINLNRESGSHENFVPKKLIHKWKGHENGTTKVQFFPNSGHLLLSGGNDHKIKLFDVYHKRELLREFYGHSQAIRDLNFNGSGSSFLSCSYDQRINEWDTETGKILNTIKTKSVPNVIRYNPQNEQEFIVGQANKKIEHYDLRVKDKIIQTYDHHLGAINSITLFDNNTKFMTTSDDKSIKFWNWQINSPIKSISDPTQYSMPKACYNPKLSAMVLQTSDNSIQVVDIKTKFNLNRKKTFTGHQCSGYGIDVAFSPDGKIVMSGDSKGFAYFWDWKTCKVVKKLKIDKRAITCIQPHPQETSKVVMSGLEGDIYYYE